ncbi:MAG: IgGFc-binding protein, partial [Myxococcales bacterium]|nr:IgGFc-binding protein [Myxococcales bacterium]
LVSADKPIAVLNYMTGYGNLPLADQTGDPAVVQLSPVEQFLPTYVIVVPDKWDLDQLVITRKTGQPVTLDGVELADPAFIAVGPDHEVGRFVVADGVHQLESPVGFSVVVVGYDYADSYAYLGGSGTGLINPRPQG